MAMESVREVGGRGGRRPGAGAPVASERDPARLCSATRADGEPCNRYKANGSEVCQKHGAGTPQARDKAVVAKATERLGLPAVPVRDYPTLVGEHVAVISSDVERINDELAALRAIGISEETLRNEHAVLFSERRQDLATLASLAKSVASLSIAKAANTAADATAAVLQSQAVSTVIATMVDALEDHPEAQAVLAERLWALVESAGGPPAIGPA